MIAFSLMVLESLLSVRKFFKGRHKRAMRYAYNRRGRASYDADVLEIIRGAGGVMWT